MRIQHNIPAMNAYRNYNNNTKALQGNLQKLSSGYKINKAGDDAAGLAISEKMRAQITGLEVAQKNAKDGISLVQTAEGALTEVHTMLNRMYSLAEQSANGTYADEVDREQLQKEVVSLRDEINRIADASNFNGKKLLDGSLSGSGATSAVSSIQLDKLDGGLTTTEKAATKFKSQANLKATSVLAKTAKDGDSITLSFSYKEGGQAKTADLTFTLSTNKDGDKVLMGNSGKEYAITNFTANGVVAADMDKAVAGELAKSKLNDSFTFDGDAYTNGYTIEGKVADSNGAQLMGYTSTATVSGVRTTKEVALGTNQANAIDAYYEGKATLFDTGDEASDHIFSVNGKKYMLAKDQADVSMVSKDVKIIFGSDLAKASENAAYEISKDTGLSVALKNGSTDGTLEFKAGSSTSGSGGLTLQIGDTSDDYNKMTVSVKDCYAAAIGVGSIDIGNQDGAADAMTAIKDAINYVSDVRGTLGSLQNRLDHTINNLSVQQENIQDAEATIRDVDVANEMMAYTKNNILVQSAQAMLAQANQLPQGVLQLLG